MNKYRKLKKRIKVLERALKDALSTFCDKEVVVTAERQEAWERALKDKCL